jgi:hypothetical protein
MRDQSFERQTENILASISAKQAEQEYALK